MLRLYYRLATIILLLIPSSSLSDGMIIGNACGKGSYSSTDLCAGSNIGSNAMSSNAEGFSWTASKSFSMFGVSIYIDHLGSNGTITCRMDTDADLSDATITGTSSTITGDGYIDIEWSGSCESITSSQTYYIGCIENSGSLGMGYGDAVCGNRRYSSSGWNMSNSDGLDVMWRAIEDD